MQKRSSISRPRYLLALVAALAAGCGGGVSRDTGPIAVDSDAISPGAYAKPLGAAADAAYANEDEAYRKRLITTFTSITPENAMKWEVVEPSRGQFDFREADSLIDFARRTNKRVRGHPLIWDVQLPAWLREREWRPRELRRVMREHIEALVRRYRGRIAEWDVVNEPLADDGGWEHNVFYRTLGPSYVPFAFRVAHRADPKARLFLNEIAAETGPKAAALLRLVRALKRRGVPIHGVGFQNHTTGPDSATPARLRHLFRSARRAGLDAAITEMDVGGTEEGPQARVYRQAARVCVRAPNCTGLTIWGVTDRFSWLEPSARALPFDEGGEPKPALPALVEPFRR